MRTVVVLLTAVAACSGCTGSGLSVNGVPYYNYNAFNCEQLQDEAADIVIEMKKATGQTPDAIKVSRTEMLNISWPDTSKLPPSVAGDFRARISAVEATSKGKSCAIQFAPSSGRAP